MGKTLKNTNQEENSKAPEKHIWKGGLKVFLIMALVFAIYFGVRTYFHLNPMAPDVQDNGAVRVVCVGDSITQGSSVILRSTETSYPKELQKLLGDDYQIINYGHNGRTVIKTGDFPYWGSKFFELSLQTEPDYVLIMLGTNDSKPQNWDAESYQLDLSELVRLYQNLESQPKVYLLTPPAAFIREGKDTVVYDIDKAIIHDEVIPSIFAVAKEHQISVIDIHSATMEHSEYFKDGVHPNEEGRKALAQYVYDSVW